MNNCCECLLRFFWLARANPPKQSQHAQSKESASLNCSEDQPDVYQIVRDINPPQNLQQSQRPNTPEIGVLINRAFEATFDTLSPASKAALSSQMTRFVIEPNQTIVDPRQQRQVFYVLTEGIAGIDGNPARQLTKGMTVGDPKLHSPTEGLVTAITRCVLWGIEHAAIEEALGTLNPMRLQKARDFISSLPMFSEIQVDQAEALAQNLVFEEWSEGEEVLNSRDPTQTFWFVKEGQISCAASQWKLSRTECFTRFLDPSEPVSRVTATEKTIVGRLSATTLCKIFGNDLERRLRRNAITEALARSKAFCSLVPSQVQKITELVTIHDYLPGDTIIPASEATRLVIILKGKALHKGKPLRRLQCIGENWLLSEKKVRLPFVAATSVQTAECSQQELKKVIQRQLSRLQSKKNLTNSLRTVWLFRYLLKADLQLLAQSFKRKHYTDKQVLAEEGMYDKSLFIVKRGTVNIISAGRQLETLQQLSYFGEQSLIGDTSRTSSAVASGPVECWVLSQHKFCTTINESLKQQLKKRIILQGDGIELTSLISVKKLGRDTSDKVNLCLHLATDYLFTVRIIKLATVIAQKSFTTLSNERQVLSRLDHPMVVKLVKIIKDSQRLFIVTEFVDGTSLEEALKRMRTCDEGRLQFCAACLVLILQYLHNEQIVYRNLNPAKIIIDTEGYLKLADFSTSKVLQGRTYTTIGTPHYMAPEVILGTGHGLNADLWSLGIVLYELANGVVPFGEQETSVPNVYKRILEAKTPVFNNTNYNQDLQVFVKQLLSENPTDRSVKDTGSLKRHPWFRGMDWVRVIQNQFSTRNHQHHFALITRSPTIIKRQSLLKLQRTEISLDRVVEKSSLPYIPKRAQQWFNDF